MESVRGAICVGICGTLLFASGFGVDMSGVANAQSLRCGSPVAVDYAAPLWTLPHLRQPKRNGSLPFTQAKIHGTPGEPNVQTGHGRIGFSFIASHIPKRGLEVGWRVRVAVSRINATGRAVRTVRHKHDTVGVAYRPGDLDFTVPANYSPGLYRYEVELSDWRGRRLARYGQYVRILRPTIKAELRARESPSFEGTQLRFQVENRGTVPISYGKGTPDRVERLEAGEWRTVHILSRKGVKRSLRAVAPGMRGPCEAVPIANDTRPGRYRVVMKVYARRADDPNVLYAPLRLRSGTYG